MKSLFIRNVDHEFTFIRSKKKYKNFKNRVIT